MKRDHRGCGDRHSREGLSLLEVLVAMAILSTVVIAVAGAVSQSARDVKRTSDHTLSLFLGEKVAEEILQEANENPRYGEHLAELGDRPRRIQNPLDLPFFGAIEDVKLPLGRLETGVDPGIDAAPRFEHYRRFELGIHLDRAKSSERGSRDPGVHEVELAWYWPGPGKKPRTSSLFLRLARQDVAPPAIPSIAQDQDGLDEEIRRLLFPLAVRPGLRGAVSQAGGVHSVVRDLGTIGVIVDHTFREVSCIQEGSAPSPSTCPAVTEAEVASRFERMAALEWQSLVFLEGPASRLSPAFSPALLGKACLPATRQEIESLVGRAVELGPRFEYHSRLAWHHYLQARRVLPLPAARPYWQLTLERKILDLAKLQVLLLRRADDLTFLTDLVEGLLRYYRGRNRAMVDFLEREIVHCGSLQALEAAHREFASQVEAAGLTREHLVKLQDRLGP